MVSPVSLRWQAWLLMLSLVLGFAAAAPAAAGDDAGPATALASHETIFHGAAVDWIWTVRGDVLLDDGSHVDTGELQVSLVCQDGSGCATEFTFVGALGTAWCSKTGGVLKGQMELYAGPSFTCVSMDLQIAGTGLCDVALNARGNDMGLHRLASSGGGPGACASPP